MKEFVIVTGSEEKSEGTNLCAAEKWNCNMKAIYFSRSRGVRIYVCDIN